MTGAPWTWRRCRAARVLLLTLSVALAGCTAGAGGTGSDETRPTIAGGAPTPDRTPSTSVSVTTTTGDTHAGDRGSDGTSAGTSGPSESGTSRLDRRVESEIADLVARWPGSRVERGRHVAVVGPSSSALHPVVEAADEAWRRCRSSWPEEVPDATIVVPGDAAQADAAAGDGRSVPPPSATTPDAAGPGLRGAAATTVVVGEAPTARTRVHLAPAATRALSEEGLRVILTHECVHVALAEVARPDAPRWLVEGVAEHVAYGLSSVERGEVLDPLFHRTRTSGPPTRLPRDEDFETGPSVSTDQVSLVYAQAWSAAEVYAREHGEQALLRLVVRGAPDGGTDRDSYRQVERDLLRVWQQALTEGQA